MQRNLHPFSINFYKSMWEMRLAMNKKKKFYIGKRSCNTVPAAYADAAGNDLHHTVQHSSIVRINSGI